SLLALGNLHKGLGRLKCNPDALNADLDRNWEVLAEAIQSVMRAAFLRGIEGMDNPYEKLKELTRGHRVDGPALREFVSTLGLPDDDTARLAELTPTAYVGRAAELARAEVAAWRSTR